MSENFFDKYDIIPTAVATIISSKVDDLAHSVVESLIIPIINRDADGDGERDIQKIEERSFKVKGIDFKIGKLFVDIIKFIFIVGVVFGLSKLFNKKKA